MKIDEQITPCKVCGGPIVPAFFEIEIKQLIVDIGAVNRYLGLVMMMNGHKALADVFTPESQFTQQVSKQKMILCMNCFMTKMGDLPVHWGDDDERQAATVAE